MVRGRQAPAKAVATTKSGRGAEAFHKGVQDLAQYLEREGGGVPGRSHVEHLRDDSEHRTGVWLANQRQRRDRLDAAQLEALAELGVDWARQEVVSFGASRAELCRILLWCC
ncbi:helicase associated domain-containing protein [Streptomyces sp. NPDC048270]|uniref:helicase associated domain-containing protein n=1 Tax=Streptomyces sp. NPDC048270 TaxID=3154615 RepID=UPI0033F0216C